MQMVFIPYNIYKLHFPDASFSQDSKTADLTNFDISCPYKQYSEVEATKISWPLPVLQSTPHPLSNRNAMLDDQYVLKDHHSTQSRASHSPAMKLPVIAFDRALKRCHTSSGKQIKHDPRQVNQWRAFHCHTSICVNILNKALCTIKRSPLSFIKLPVAGM